MTDIIFVNPNSSESAYQSLSSKYTAIEPPTWALLLAESVRQKGWKVVILDALAESLSAQQTVDRIIESSARLVCFVVYGQNVNSGAANMTGASKVANLLRENKFGGKVSLIGSYIQALPIKTMQDELSFDFGFTNEGVYSLWEILTLQEITDKSLSSVKGIVWRDSTGKIRLNPSSALVPSEKMDLDLPGYAWDLLPFKNTPLDLYRSPLWHAEYDEDKRTPYAAIQTSLGCNFGCDFCMINIINRNDEAEIGVASNYSKMRFWSPQFIAKQIDKLAALGVRTIRIVDEMFLLYRKHYVPLCEMLSKKPYAPELRMWAYSRIDTVTNPEFLQLVRNAGIKWLALGIESAEREVRLEVSKGKFQDVDIRKVITQIHDADIEVMANFIVGLPGEDEKRMQKTLDFSLELCTSGWNMYAAMALPGSQLYKTALEKGYPLPETYEAFSFHSYETLPMPTEFLTPGEVLDFRDNAFLTYHKNPLFLERVKSKFGQKAVNTIQEMTKLKLKRKITSS